MGNQESCKHLEITMRKLLLCRCCLHVDPETLHGCGEYTWGYSMGRPPSWWQVDGAEVPLMHPTRSSAKCAVWGRAELPLPEVGAAAAVEYVSEMNTE